MNVTDERNFEAAIKLASEEYLLEYMDKQLEIFQGMDEPPCSKKQKERLTHFFEHRAQARLRKRNRICKIAAVFLCLCIFFNQHISASMKRVFHTVSTKQTEVSLDIKKETMYVSYDFSAFPPDWELLYLPNELIAGYAVDTVAGSSSKIEILFLNARGEKLLYTLSKEKTQLPPQAYEEMEINGSTAYYCEKNGTKLLYCETESPLQIEMETQCLRKKDFIQIAKNIVPIYR